jgi:hypothetical protein
MRARQDKSQIPAGLNDGEDILTYNGKGNRVTTVNCKDFCGGKWYPKVEFTPYSCC